jgi:fermentation-respiration switch protein FrsA (DUF1100 family)
VLTKTDNPASAQTRRARWKRLAWRAVRLVLLVYLGVMLVISLLQEWMIFPGRSTQGQKHALIKPMRDTELVQLTTSLGDRIYVLFGNALETTGLKPRHDAARRPTLIFFYGNGMCLADGLDLLRDWQKLGANVLGVEYPGYGMSSGKPGEKAFNAAADAAYEWLVARPDIDKTKIIPLGLSIGSGPAVDLASRKSVAALVLLAPFTSLDDMARALLPWVPASSKLLRHHFDNAGKIGNLSIPIFIAHGCRDSIIPCEMSAKLARAATKANVTRIEVECDHNDMFELAGDAINEEMAKVIAEVADRQ